LYLIMPDNDVTSQYFMPDANGGSQAVAKIVADTTEALQSSLIKARGRQFKSSPPSALAIDGIPGIPFERGEPNPDTFFQGEDIVYDLFLFYDGKPVSSEEFDVLISLKTSPRAGTASWLGSTTDMGVYPTPTGSGYYEVWIPSSVTDNLLAGTYHLDVLIKEKLGSGKGRYDRKYMILQTYLNIDYGNFSLRPETAGRAAENPSKRSDAEPTWPNSPNTIGTTSIAADIYLVEQG